MRKGIRRTALVLCGCLLLGGCTGMTADKPRTRTSFLLDTTVSVTLYDGDTALLDGCMERISRYEALFSRTAAGSDIDRIDRGGGEPVTVSEETAALLRTALEMGERTGGALDITVAPLMELWGFGGEPAVPEAAAVADTLALVDYTRLELEGTTVRLPAGMALDLGALAKGYIADRLRKYLLENGCSSAIIDLGGNILVVGDKAGEPFEIGIQDPRESGRLAATIPVKDRSVVTSGAYQRYFEENGERYHHILDPHTGYPANTGLLSVTVVSESSLDGDALSTACFVLGADRGSELVESLPGVEALFILADGTQRRTTGFPKG